METKLFSQFGENFWSNWKNTTWTCWITNIENKMTTNENSLFYYGNILYMQVRHLTKIANFENLVKWKSLYKGTIRVYLKISNIQQCFEQHNDILDLFIFCSIFIIKNKLFCLKMEENYENLINSAVHMMNIFILGLRGLPELRGRSTGSMVTNFVLGITFSHKILVKLRGLRRHFTQVSFENVTQEKIPNPSYSGRSP